MSGFHSFCSLKLGKQGRDTLKTGTIKDLTCQLLFNAASSLDYALFQFLTELHKCNYKYIPPYYRICTYRLSLPTLNVILHFRSNSHFPFYNRVAPTDTDILPVYIFTSLSNSHCSALEKSQAVVY